VITIDLEKLQLSPGDRILDMGCGEGRHTATVCGSQGVWCVGSDKNFQDLVQTREKLDVHRRMGDFSAAGASLAASDIRAIPFQTESFDTVICSEVLEHIDRDKQAVRELLRVLKRGKILAVSVPKFFPEKVCWMLSKAYSSESGGHIRIYRKQALIGMIEGLGARHVKTGYAHSLHVPFWWLKCLVGNNRQDSALVNLYHRFLVWDLMEKPAVTRTLEKLLDPLFGKSLVLYFVKDA
jgi:SAM-dependent methyltransferase